MLDIFKQNQFKSHNFLRCSHLIPQQLVLFSEGEKKNNQANQMPSLLVGKATVLPVLLPPQSPLIGPAGHAPTGQTRHVLNAALEGAVGLEAAYI